MFLRAQGKKNRQNPQLIPRSEESTRATLRAKRKKTPFACAYPPQAGSLRRLSNFLLKNDHKKQRAGRVYVSSQFRSSIKALLFSTAQINGELLSSVFFTPATHTHSLALSFSSYFLLCWGRVLSLFVSLIKYIVLLGISALSNLMRRSIITFEERPNTRERNRQRASVHGCLDGGNPSDIYLWWVLWISICRMRGS